MAFTERERQIMVGVDLEPQTADEGALQAFAESSSTGGGLPPVTDEDAGKTLIVQERGWVVETALPSLPMMVHGTINLEDNSVALEMTAQALYQAVSSGYAIHVEMPVDDVIIQMTTSPTAQAIGSTYSFGMIGPNGVSYKTNDLSADAPVVFAPVGNG